MMFLLALLPNSSLPSCRIHRHRDWRHLLWVIALCLMGASPGVARSDASITFACCAYSPPNVVITVGESVSWSGTFTFHPLRQVDGPSSDTPVPGGFANSTGTFYSVQFNTPGTYYYQCANHGLAQFGGTMRGSVTVLSTGVTFTGSWSRKVHATAGPFDIAIDTTQAIGGNVTVEPRGIGSGHTIVFRFSGPVTAPGTVSVTPVGTAGTPSVSNNEVLIPLTNVPDNRRVTITLANVNGSVNPPPVSLGFLVGDVSNSRSINAADIAATKANGGKTSLDNPSAKFDLNADGAITPADLSAVKARSGQVLAP